MNKIRKDLLQSALELLEQAATRVQSVREAEEADAEEASGKRAETLQEEVDQLGEADEAIANAVTSINEVLGE